MKRSERKQIGEYAQAARLPGLVVSSFTRDDEERLAWGHSFVEGGIDLEEDACFPIASVTKTFTADLVMCEEFRDHLSLDEPIRAVWPDFAHPDPGATAEMTPREALGHYSGLAPHTWAWVFGDQSRRDFFHKRFSHLPVSGPFRERHRYSNVIYAAMGQLIEEVSGQSWERRVQQVILNNLGLLDTGFLSETPRDEFGMLAFAYAEENITRCIRTFLYRDHHLIAPASEMISTAPDLARWGQTLLGLDPDDARWRPVSPISDGLSYGLGWRLDARNGHRRAWHSGQCTGYTSLMTLYPERGRGCVLLCNRSNALPALQAVEAFLLDGVELPPPVSEVRKTPSPALPNFGNGRLPTGIFQNPGYGPLALFEEEGCVWSRFQNGDAVEVLESPDGTPLLQLPVFGVRFPLRAEADRLFVPFEPAIPEIIFNHG